MNYKEMVKHTYTDLIDLHNWQRKGCKINRGNTLCKSYKTCCICPYSLKEYTKY